MLFCLYLLKYILRIIWGIAIYKAEKERKRSFIHWFTFQNNHNRWQWVRLKLRTQNSTWVSSMGVRMYCWSYYILPDRKPSLANLVRSQLSPWRQRRGILLTLQQGCYLFRSEGKRRTSKSTKPSHPARHPRQGGEWGNILNSINPHYEYCSGPQFFLRWQPCIFSVIYFH